MISKAANWLLELMMLLANDLLCLGVETGGGKARAFLMIPPAGRGAACLGCAKAEARKPPSGCDD